MVTHKIDPKQWWRIEFEPTRGGLYRLVFPGPFQRSHEAYRLAGWSGTLPLPAGRKNPPPTGYTGHKAPDPTGAQIETWAGDPQRRGANICLRLARIKPEPENGIDGCEVVGIDVDHYIKGGKVKRGGDQLAALEAKLGTLPDTWTSSARTDGKSGIRYFRVPVGLTFKGQVAQDIECIYKGYRFAVVWPSTNPDANGETYWWFRPGIAPTADGRAAWNPDLDALPVPTDLPLLPDAWLEHLQKCNGATDHEMDDTATVDEIYDWADATFNDSAGNAMCARVAKSVRQHADKIRNEATSHDKQLNVHWHLYNLAKEGHTGWKAAIAELENIYIAEVMERDKRGRAEVHGELFRSRTNALRKVKSRIDRNVAIGATAVPSLCPCVTGNPPGDGHRGFLPTFKPRFAPKYLRKFR